MEPIFTAWLQVINTGGAVAIIALVVWRTPEIIRELLAFVRFMVESHLEAVRILADRCLQQHDAARRIGGHQGDQGDGGKGEGG